MRITWLKPEERIEHEFRALEEEGLDASSLKSEWLAGQNVAPSERRALAERLLDEARAFSETVSKPNETDLIAALQRLPKTQTRFSDSELERSILAGWTGRMAGCLLGKPVEKVRRAGIRAILHSAKRWPLNQYFSSNGVPQNILEQYPWNHASRTTSLLENIKCMPEDDDINYAMLNLAVLEKAGIDFSTEDIGTAWLEMMPALTVFTAERVAYVNLLEYLEPPETARHRNPYREWIGAQIRADVWGWVSPGDPAMAAQLAWRDARLSHVENGIYAEMFVAAMVAAAFTCDDSREIILEGLSVIPGESRLAEAIRFTLELPSLEPDWEAGLDRLYRRYGHYHWVHAINNAALVSAALLYGAGDFERSICLAVMGGWDTDCNGATVGSIVGTMGARIPEKWSEPLNNRVRSSLSGFDFSSIDDLARRTVAQVPKAYR